jgi:hypothetical protein
MFNAGRLIPARLQRLNNQNLKAKDTEEDDRKSIAPEETDTRRSSWWWAYADATTTMRANVDRPEIENIVEIKG